MNKDKLRSIRRKTRIRKKLKDVKKHKLLIFRSSNIYMPQFSQNKMIKLYVLIPQLKLIRLMAKKN